MKAARKVERMVERMVERKAERKAEKLDLKKVERWAVQMAD